MNTLNNNNKLINDKNDLSVETVELFELLNELLEILKIVENCASCKDNLDNIDKSIISKIENCLIELEKEQKQRIIDELNNELIETNIRLNNEILCKGCKEKEIDKLINKCGNEEIAKFLYYECKLNAKCRCYTYIRWIPFDEFKNIEYLAKGGFGEVHKATWIKDYYRPKVVLKRIYNSSDKIADILKEVK